MASRTIPQSPVDHPIHWKQAFESAVQQLRGEKADRAKQPICPRKQASPADSKAIDQNRSLNDPADALAALWKTSTKGTSRSR